MYPGNHIINLLNIRLSTHAKILPFATLRSPALHVHLRNNLNIIKIWIYLENVRPTDSTVPDYSDRSGPAGGPQIRRIPRYPSRRPHAHASRLPCAACPQRTRCEPRVPPCGPHESHESYRKRSPKGRVRAPTYRTVGPRVSERVPTAGGILSELRCQSSGDRTVFGLSLTRQ